MKSTEIVTKKKIDAFKNYMFENRKRLSQEQLISMENDFIDMCKLYVYLYPHRTKTIRMLRNWYRLVREELHSCINCSGCVQINIP